MGIVVWVCSKFFTLSSSAKTLKIGYDLTSYREFKGENFF